MSRVFLAGGISSRHAFQAHNLDYYCVCGGQCAHGLSHKTFSTLIIVKQNRSYWEKNNWNRLKSRKSVEDYIIMYEYDGYIIYFFVEFERDGTTAQKTVSITGTCVQTVLVLCRAGILCVTLYRVTGQPCLRTRETGKGKDKRT